MRRWTASAALVPTLEKRTRTHAIRRYASAISKNFASAVAIVVTAALSAEARSCPMFRAGIVAVVGSMALFQATPPLAPRAGEKKS